MKRRKLRIKLGIDLAMIAVFIINMFTGFAMFFGMVLGGGRQYGGITGFNIENLSNLSARAWYRFVHDWSGILIVILILLHLILNWNTLWCYLRNMWRSSVVREVSIDESIGKGVNASCEMPVKSQPAHHS